MNESPPLAPTLAPYPPPSNDYIDASGYIANISYDSVSGCGSGDFACYDTSVSGQNLLTSLVVDSIIGLLCYAGFVLWRGSFPVYHGREILPGVRRRPPPLKLGGHWQIW